MTALRLVSGVASATPGDPDLLDFEFWQRELRGLRPTTIRVRIDLLARVSTFVDKPTPRTTRARPLTS